MIVLTESFIQQCAKKIKTPYEEKWNKFIFIITDPAGIFTKRFLHYNKLSLKQSKS